MVITNAVNVSQPPIPTQADAWSAGALGALVGGCLTLPAVRLFVGAHASHVQGEHQNLTGDRCFTAAHRPPAAYAPGQAAELTAILDSGAFSDPWDRRLSAAAALDRQLAWEARAARIWHAPGWRADALVSYDLLIDEVWLNGKRTKRRWSVTDAAPAVDVTVAAAQYLASQRAALAPRTLMLSCQGVTPAQYEGCVRRVLEVATPADWIGFGGWCILGRFTTWLPAFYEMLTRCLSLIAGAGVRHIHILGVLYLPALGPLVWLADQHGLTVSTDSSAPILACTWRGAEKLKKSGARAPYWRDNVEVWRHTLATLRETRYYAPPQWQQGWDL